MAGDMKNIGTDVFGNPEEGEAPEVPDEDYAQQVAALAASIIGDEKLSKKEKKAKVSDLIDLLDDATPAASVEQYFRGETRKARRKINLKYGVMMENCRGQIGSRPEDVAAKLRGW